MNNDRTSERFGLRRLRHALLIACVLPMALAVGHALAQSAAPQLADLPDAAKAGAQGSIDTFMKSTGLRASRSANDLGWDCLAATELGASGDVRAAAKVRSITAELMRDMIKSLDGKPLGWTAVVADKKCPDGGYDAFQDGTCNGPDTVYALQSGLGVACFARASKLLNQPALLTTAKAVLASWQAIVLPKAPCADCIYFPTSNSPNDANRYVRNMNVFMAFGAASLGAAGDADAMQVARRAMASDVAEDERKNKGYLGILDRQWAKSKLEADRIENHAASIAILAQQIGRILDDRHVEDYAKAVWQDWAYCSNDRCRNATCNYWAADPNRCQATQTAAHCAFRSADPRARDLCLQFLSKTSGVGPFGILSLSLGRDKARK